MNQTQLLESIAGLAAPRLAVTLLNGVALSVDAADPTTAGIVDRPTGVTTVTVLVQYTHGAGGSATGTAHFIATAAIAPDPAAPATYVEVPVLTTADGSITIADIGDEGGAFTFRLPPGSVGVGMFAFDNDAAHAGTATVKIIFS